MSTLTDPMTLWVCVDCYYAANGLECDDDITPDCEPLSQCDGLELTAGLVYAEHECEEPGESECGCEEQTFSRSHCHGCGSWLAGSRHALTGWERV